MQIAIDGPAGAGKSSVAKEVARRMNLNCLDTGAMYRAVTLKALKEGIDVHDGKRMGKLAKDCKLSVEYNENEGTLIFLDGEDVTGEIRSSRVNQHVSIVASSPELRKELVYLQRRVADESGGIVMEGRDIGTDVLTGADFKFFLYASIEERAKRRWLEMKSKGTDVDFNELLEEIATRDRLDEERKASPLKVAAGAKVIDTTNYSLEEAISAVLDFIKQNSEEGQ
ncbi:MAG: (d)CMP kinase [Bacillota bacterium]|nr:(d)CMP kinase [Bacillota bacterium]